MELNKDEFEKKLLNIILRSKKIHDFESTVPVSIGIIMSIKNREDRLTSLLRLKEDIEKDIEEIVKLSDLKRIFHENMTLADCLEINVTPTKESIKRREDLATIKRLKDYKTPIIKEIEKLKFLRNAKKKSNTKSIEEQFIDLFRDFSKAGMVIACFKSKGYIDDDEKWIGKTSHKGELKEAYQVLKDNGLLKVGNTTTHARVFYKRFKYDGVCNERTFRNNLKDFEIINEFKTLFNFLFKK